MLGDAREKHIRAAVKELHKAGMTRCNGVGPVRQLHVTPAAAYRDNPRDPRGRGAAARRAIPVVRPDYRTRTRHRLACTTMRHTLVAS